MNKSIVMITKLRECKIAIFLFYFLSISRGFSQNIEYAESMYRMFENGDFKDSSIYIESEKTYLKILEKDSLNFRANYGLSALYMNTGVHYQNLLKNNVDIYSNAEINRNWDIMIIYLEKALPYLERTKRLVPKN